MPESEKFLSITHRVLRRGSAGVMLFASGGDNPDEAPEARGNRFPPTQSSNSLQLVLTQVRFLYAVLPL